MRKDRGSISGAKSYMEAGEFWDSHDLDEVWDRTKTVDIEVELQSEKFFFSVEGELASRIQAVAHSRGVSSETLVNLWLQEKLAAAGP